MQHSALSPAVLVNTLTDRTQPVCIGHRAQAHPPDPTRGSTPRTHAACYSQPPGQTDLETEVRDHPDHCRAVALPHLPQTFFLDQIAEESRLQHGPGANVKQCPHEQIHQDSIRLTLQADCMYPIRARLQGGVCRRRTAWGHCAVTWRDTHDFLVARLNLVQDLEPLDGRDNGSCTCSSKAACNHHLSPSFLLRGRHRACAWELATWSWGTWPASVVTLTPSPHTHARALCSHYACVWHRISWCCPD